MEREEKAHRKRRTRPYARHGGYIAGVQDFERMFIFQKPQAFSRGRVLYVFDIFYALCLKIANTIPMVKKRRQDAALKIRVSIDRTRNNGTSVLLVV
jgi:hypothetical protein